MSDPEQQPEDPYAPLVTRHGAGAAVLAVLEWSQVGEGAGVTMDALAARVAAHACDAEAAVIDAALEIPMQAPDFAPQRFVWPDEMKDRFTHHADELRQEHDLMRAVRVAYRRAAEECGQPAVPTPSAEYLRGRYYEIRRHNMCASRRSLTHSRAR